jgi:hypothetical protein
MKTARKLKRIQERQFSAQSGAQTARDVGGVVLREDESNIFALRMRRLFMSVLPAPDIFQKRTCLGKRSRNLKPASHRVWRVCEGVFVLKIYCVWKAISEV